MALQIKLPPTAKDFIQKLLCNVEDRLGTRAGAAEVKVSFLCVPALWQHPHVLLSTTWLIFVHWCPYGYLLLADRSLTGVV